MQIIRVDEDTTIDELLADLHECSRYAQSEQRTHSTDVLLDLVLEWAGVG